jgi:tetratricopeptide (TPR) repeat protein
MRSKCEDLAIGSNRNFFWQEEFKAAGDLFDQGRFEEAAQRYRNAIAVDDSEDRAWLNLGLTHANLADYDQAVDALAMAHELDPTDERTTEFYRKTLQSKAIEEYSASAEPVTSDPAQARQLVESALARLDIALSLDPPAAERMGYLDNKSIILRFLADLHEQVEEGSGRDTFAAAIEARRSAAVARSEAVAAGSVDAADADEARRDNLLFTIICFDAMGEVDSTLIYAKRVIDLDPTQAEGYSFVASALNTKGDKQESIRYLLMNFCLSERGKKVDDVNAHFIDLLNSYEATDEIIMASITNPETPTEIRIYADGSHVYESWLFWSEGYANCYYDGKNLGKVEFEPVPTP